MNSIHSKDNYFSVTKFFINIIDKIDDKKVNKIAAFALFTFAFCACSLSVVTGIGSFGPGIYCKFAKIGMIGDLKKINDIFFPATMSSSIILSFGGGLFFVTGLSFYFEAISKKEKNAHVKKNTVNNVNRLNLSYVKVCDYNKEVMTNGYTGGYIS